MATERADLKMIDRAVLRALAKEPLRASDLFYEVLASISDAGVGIMQQYRALDRSLQRLKADGKIKFRGRSIGWQKVKP